MAQQTGRQYDDDLTVGADEYDESFSTGYVDLFEPLGDDDAPIAKLKTIVLSIDWEITDDILQQLHDELLDLKDIWADNKINLIYLQALEKLGRYISTEKSHSHPNAIKLLLAFYYNLEKIVSSSSMSEEEKKRLLLQDVKKFDQFKLQIAPGAQEKKKAGESPVAVASPAVAAAKPLSPVQGKADVLTNLKAIVLSIDWEISDKELARLSEEVSKLEKTFSDSRAKLIFLQGIGALGNYIRSTKSNAHPDAFKLFHSFYAGLEKICYENLTSEQEKKNLLIEVEKFNAFKSVIATIASAVVVPPEEASSAVDDDFAEEEVEGEEGREGGTITPAFADVPEDVHGFREDVAVTGEIDTRVASFLGVDEGQGRQQRAVVTPAYEEVPEYHEVTSSLDALFGEDEEATPSVEAADVALSGVDVETEADDDSDEKTLPMQAGVLAPALIEANGRSLYAEPVTAGPESSKLSFEVTAVIPGVDVETEADDDSEEAALPQEQGSVAPALAFSDEKYGYRETDLVAGADEDVSDLEDRLHSFFGEEIEEASQGKSLSLSDDTGDTEGVLSIEAIQEEPVLHDIQDDEQVAVIEDEESGLVSLSEFLEATSTDDTEKESVVSLVEETWTFDEDAKEVEPEVVAAAVEDQVWSDVTELTEDRNVEVAEETATEESVPEVELESVVETAGVEEAEAPEAAVFVAEPEAEASAVGLAETLEVVFEPVADDVEVDELPCTLGTVVDADVITQASDSFLGLQECVSSILLKEYDEAFPDFHAKIDGLRQGWQGQYVYTTILQLMLTVGQYIDTYRTEADPEAFTLLKSLGDTLAKICTTKAGFDMGCQQMLAEEVTKVLLWQQGLIATLTAKQERGDSFSGVVGGTAGLFSGE